MLVVMPFVLEPSEKERKARNQHQKRSNIFGAEHATMSEHHLLLNRKQMRVVFPVKLLFLGLASAIMLGYVVRKVTLRRHVNTTPWTEDLTAK